MLVVFYPTDGGLVHDGKFYADADALCCALGYDQEDIEVQIIGWNWGCTAAELLA